MPGQGWLAASRSPPPPVPPIVPSYPQSIAPRSLKKPSLFSPSSRVHPPVRHRHHPADHPSISSHRQPLLICTPGCRALLSNRHLVTKGRPRRSAILHAASAARFFSSPSSLSFSFPLAFAPRHLSYPSLAPFFLRPSAVPPPLLSHTALYLFLNLLFTHSPSSQLPHPPEIVVPW